MDHLREGVRDIKSKERDYLRQSLLNRNRSLVHSVPFNIITEYDTVEIAKKMKRKGDITKELLSSLKSAFLQKEINITAFLKTDGALQSLVREISGHKAVYQIESTYCICNLALVNDEKSALKIIQASAPYLILHLESMNAYLIEASCWALGNLLSHGGQCVMALNALGVLNHLVSLLSHKKEFVAIASVYALSFLFCHPIEGSQLTDLSVCIIAILNFFDRDSQATSYLLSLVSSYVTFHRLLVDQEIHLKIMVRLNLCLQLYGNDVVIKEITGYLRTLSNLVLSLSPEELHILLAYRHEHEIILKSILKFVANSGHKFLQKEFLWFLGNLTNYRCPSISHLLSEFLLESETLISSLVIPL